jgi:glycosyltransferase involved in cell wall biosynthesis
MLKFDKFFNGVPFMANISIICSTYRSEAYLTKFTENVSTLADFFKQQAWVLELVIVANDATDNERTILDKLKTLQHFNFVVQISYVARESIYASWNRGVKLATSPYITFWGVDDTRSAMALLLGHNMLKNGCELVYFPYEVLTTVDWSVVKTTNKQVAGTLPFNKNSFGKNMRIGPFWMTTKDLFNRVGDFDENFKVVGDFDWCNRALQLVDFHLHQEVGGVFVVHGENLSSNYNPMKIVEENIVYLRYGHFDMLRPCDPELMKTAWQTWGAQGRTLTPEQEAWLWGQGAKEREQKWLENWQNKQREENIRQVPRSIMERLGLRPLFAKLGIVKSNT